MNEPTEKDFKRIFNFNNLLSKVLGAAAYIIASISIIVLIYLSFISRFKIKIDWLTLGIFTTAAVGLSYLNWTVFYKKQFEKFMSDDISQYHAKKYSIHARYYTAIHDWSDIELQQKIDEFNDEYTAKWLRWVEKYTGVPVESSYVVKLNDDKTPVLDDTGKPIKILVKGIKDLPYKGFKHKIIMWRIKNHVYPQSGYKTSMELMSLISFQDSNLNKRNLRADKNYFAFKATSRFMSSLMAITVGASVIPEMITGQYWTAILKLGIAVVSVLLAIVIGAANGVTGARLKLSTVEDACSDLERWSGKKPVLEPFTLFESEQEVNSSEDIVGTKPEVMPTVTTDIFKIPKLPR